MPHGIGRSSKRMDGSGAPAVVKANCAIGAGWGTTGDFTVAAGSTEQRGSATITAGGASFAQATATFTITFPGGTRPYAPFAMADATNDNAIDTGRFRCVTSTTQLVATHSVLPVDTRVYIVTWLIPD